MGCDGGSIVGRAELVKVVARPTRPHSHRSLESDRQNCCALSQEELSQPVVACAMGNLYNKEAIIQYLLAKNNVPHLSHIRALKDLLPVTLNWSTTKDQAAVDTEEESKEKSPSAHTASGSTDPTTLRTALYTCPVLTLPSNGANKFIALQPCGCVISEKAWKSVGIKGGETPTCIVCSKQVGGDEPTLNAAASAASSSSSSSSAPSPFFHPAYLTLCPGPEESLYMRGVIAERIKIREAEKAAKKAAKKSNNAHATSSSSEPAASTAASASAIAGKRKADDQAVVDPASSDTHTAKKQIIPSRTGNTISDAVRSITQSAAAAVAERRKDAGFSAIFINKQTAGNTKLDAISTKPASAMSRL